MEELNITNLWKYYEIPKELNNNLSNTLELMIMLAADMINSEIKKQNTTAL